MSDLNQNGEIKMAIMLCIGEVKMR